jgi:thiol-disulfide isomerase/thioredoxin
MTVIKYFYSENCSFCETMKPRILNLVKNGYDIEVLEVDSHNDIADEYDIERMPTFIFEVDGEEIERWTGVTDELTIEQKFRQ